MVAGNGDDIDSGQIPTHPGEEFVEHLLAGGRRVGAVEDVAGDQQGVGPFRDERVAQPGEEAPVLMHAVIAVQDLSQVPVGGVEESHRAAFMSIQAE